MGKEIDLKIVEIEEDSRHVIVEGPEGFQVKIASPAPGQMKVGEIIGVDEEQWNEWKAFWDKGPPGTH